MARETGDRHGYDGKASTGETRGKGEHTYHYSREERLSRLSFDPGKAKKGGIFKGNRSLAIILLDVLIILFLVFILVPFLQSIRSPHQWIGYGVDGSAVRFEDRILVKIDIENSRGRGRSPGAPISISLGFEPGNVIQEAADFLPQADEETRSYRTSLPSKAGADTVYVVLEAADGSFETAMNIE